MSLNGRDGPDD